MLFRSVNATGSFVNGSPTTTYVLQKRTYDGTHTPEPIGLTIYPGKYIDTKGFLSWNNRLQDNYYYQEFSYVIRVSELVDKYRNIIKSLVHPSGTKMFGDYKIGVSIATPISFVRASSNLEAVKLEESVTATDVIVGRSIIPASISESITTTDTVVGTYNSVNLTSGTESVTADDSIVGNQTIPAATLDGSGYIESYASSTILPYETTTIQDLINSSLTLDDSSNATIT